MAATTVKSFDGVPIACETHGAGSPAIVLVHGGMCNRTDWEKSVPILAAAHQVVTLDLAGHGESGTGRQEWTVPNWARDVQAVVEALDLKKVVLAGHSLGSAVVVEAARLMPERVAGVVAVDGFVYFGYNAIRDPNVVNAALAPYREDFQAGVQGMCNGLFLPTSDPALVRRCTDEMKSMPAAIGVPMLAALYDWGGEEVLPHVKAPVQCIVSGLYAPMKAAGYILPIADQLKITQIPESGHWVMLEAPETFSRLLLGAIDEMVN